MPNTTPSPRAWWKSAPRIPTLALFAVVAAALLGTFSLILATVEIERTQRQQAARTSDILTSLDEIETSTMNGETGQRGYFITSDVRYLVPYREGQARYRAEIQRLRERMGNDVPADQKRLLAEIDRLQTENAELIEILALKKRARPSKETSQT